jgi:hypothetical protein
MPGLKSRPISETRLTKRAKPWRSGLGLTGTMGCEDERLIGGMGYLVSA